MMASGAVALALLVSGCDQAKAQRGDNPERVSSYVVMPGDNLWELSRLKLGDGERWRTLEAQNPVLSEKWRYTTMANGGQRVHLEPGLVLHGLEEAGINLAAKVATPTDKVAFTGGQPAAKAEPTWFDKNWGWLLGLLALTAVVAAGLLLRRRRREQRLDREYRDPVGSGPAMITGGVTDETVAQTFAERGQTQARRFTIIGEVVRGLGYGEMLVSFRGGRQERKLLNGHSLYQATVLYEGETEPVEIFMLERCANDVRYGNSNVPGREFRFERLTSVAAAPQPPAPVPEAVAPEPESAPAPVAAAEPPVEVSEAAAPERMPKLTIELRPADGEHQGSMIRVKGAGTNDLKVTVYEDEVTVRYYAPGQVPQPSEVSAAEPVREAETA